MIQATSIRKRILRRIVGHIELTALKSANCVLYCTEKDFALLEIESQNVTGIHLPNGVFQHKRETYSRKTASFIFVGSAHEPNVIASSILVEIARNMPEIEINIVGDVCSEIKGAGTNVNLLGRVSESDLEALLSSCSAFLNPVTQGSGMHLKIARAIASGIPIITTEFGARGFNLQNKKSAIFAESEEFGEAIRHFLRMGSKKVNLALEASKNHKGKLFWEDLVDTNRILCTNHPKHDPSYQKHDS
jgi:glycosyltransferase involved in cell wall biosynthesis